LIKTIVFDFGNVIGFFDHWLVTKRLAAHGDVPAEEFHSFLFGGSLEDEYEKGRIDSAEFLKCVRERGRLRCSEEVLVADYTEIFWPNAEVCALLPQLKPSYRLLLASNTSELHSRQFRRQFADILRVFDALVLSHEIGVRKPERAFFVRCLGLAGCGAGECVFIDDLPANVAGARACGWHGILYTGIENLRRDLAALGIQSLAEARNG
jgi:putative hydrolase of the HAD superfamily